VFFFLKKKYKTNKYKAIIKLILNKENDVMKKFLIMGMVCSGLLYAVGGLNEVTVEDSDIDNTSKLDVEAKNEGTSTNGGTIQNAAGQLNIQQSSSVHSSIKLDDVDVRNDGEVVARAENYGDASNGGTVQNAAGQLNIQQSGAISSETTVEDTDITNTGTVEATAVNHGGANIGSTQNAAGQLNIQN